MSRRTATIESLPMAFDYVKAMQGEGMGWGEGYRPLAREAIAEIIEMAAAVDRHVEAVEAGAPAERRNGFHRRNLLTELGDIELAVPLAATARPRWCAPMPAAPPRSIG